MSDLLDRAREHYGPNLEGETASIIANLIAEIERLQAVERDRERIVTEIRDWWLDGEKRQVWMGGSWLQHLLGLDENWKMDGEVKP
jgi:hypothetical protein